jgi:hypothetical protein
MPKPFKPLLFCLALLMLASCDKPSRPRHELIVGTWKFARLQSHVWHKGQLAITPEQIAAKDRDSMSPGSSFVFYADSTFVYHFLFYGQEGGRYGRYFLEQGATCLALGHPTKETRLDEVVYTIVTLSEDSLVLEDERWILEYVRKRTP